VAADSVADGRAKCIRQFAEIAKKNAKFLSNLAKIVLFTAKTVFPSVKLAVVK